MSPKAEYAAIMFVSAVLPIATFLLANPYFDTLYTFAEPTTRFIWTPDSSRPISILFVGDIMLDRTIRKDGEAQGYKELFSCLPEMFEGHDEVVGNLEGAVTDNVSVSRDAAYEAPESFRFTFDPSSVRALADAGLSIVSIANNHIRDFGDDGIAQTIAYTHGMGLTAFGDPRAGGQNYVVQDINGTNVAFIGYNQFFGSAEGTLSDIKSATEQSDLQIVFPHWGDEYVPVRPDVRALAHQFADAGADLIIGAHPHVIQESETYKGVPIYYSLGNFIFDQYWEPAVATGMMVEVAIVDKKISVGREILTRSIRHGGTCLK